MTTLDNLMRIVTNIVLHE